MEPTTNFRLVTNRLAGRTGASSRLARNPAAMAPKLELASAGAKQNTLSNIENAWEKKKKRFLAILM